MPADADTDLYEYGGGRVIACAVIFLVICTLTLALRFYAHWLDRRPNRLEDWILLPAWLLLVGLCINVIIAVQLGGVGRHEAYVLKFEPQALTTWAQTLFVTELIYGPVIALEKSSILLFYWRIFHINRWFRLTAVAMIIYIWMWAAGEWFTALFQCIPVAKQWIQKLDGSCIDRLAFFRWICLPNAVHDVAMLVLPVPMVWKLQMASRQKAALGTIFLLGSFGCVASFIRMSRFFLLDAFSDNTWASIQLMAWTVAEPGVILICACMPALWPLLQRLMPSVFHLRSQGKSSGGNASHSHHSSRRPPAGVDSSVWPGGHPKAQGSTGDFVPLVDVGGAHAQHGFDHVQTPGRGGIHVSTNYGWAVEVRSDAERSV